MEVRLLLDSKEQGEKIKQNMDKAGQMVRTAMQGAAKDAADEILFRGAEDISDAGNFGDQWQEALNVDIQETQRTIRVITSMQGGPPVSYWHVFEYGATMVPHNPSGLLWLPFPGSEGTEMWPSVYPGPLFQVTSKAGNEVLFDTETKEPKYFGKESVTIDQKFHLRAIIAQVAKELKTYYAEHMRG